MKGNWSLSSARLRKAWLNFVTMRIHSFLAIIVNGRLFALDACVAPIYGIKFYAIHRWPIKYLLSSYVSRGDKLNQLTWTFRPRRAAMDLEFRREGSSWRSLIELIKYYWVIQLISRLVLLSRGDDGREERNRCVRTTVTLFVFFQFRDWRKFLLAQEKETINCVDASSSSRKK